ncbi:helix-turn-helix transcriptional regulator [Ohtaekwangia kribbensis]|jgi:transcriptional regulator with XRE-family HTH domain|uniref:Helix-turn-helix transcriptional regulator n=1 Tax=Ohtaekwangia kribbensis TaxID=688913 RepID=A0ABW3K1D1_9BACT
MATDNHKIHQGRNVKRFREVLGMKQEALADQLGEDWSQKRISMLENKELIEDDILQELAKALKVPAEAIKNFNEETAFNVINNTFTSNDTSSINNGVNYYPTFNPFDELLRISNEKDELYKALLKEKDEKIVLLQRFLDAGK